LLLENPGTWLPAPSSCRLSDPKQQGGGHDPLIGQNDTAGEGCVRTFTIASTDEQGQR
jgi:hypothetical protein